MILAIPHLFWYIFIIIQFKISCKLSCDYFLLSLGCFSSVQSLSCVWFFATPWTAASQTSLSIPNSWSLLKFMSIELVMPSNHPSSAFMKHSYIMFPLRWPKKAHSSLIPPGSGWNEQDQHFRAPPIWPYVVWTLSTTSSRANGLL